MLFDFHKRQNEKKLHSVHACYVLDGFLKSSESAVPGPNQVDDTNDEANNQDSVPQSSPFMSSAPTMDVDGSHDTSSSTRQIVIVKEEHVQGKSMHETLSILPFFRNVVMYLIPDIPIRTFGQI